jgi:hypothetical protein
MITNELRPRLHEYLAGLVPGLHGTPLEINGTADHVHVLARIKPVIRFPNSFLSLRPIRPAGPGGRRKIDLSGK